MPVKGYKMTEEQIEKNRVSHIGKKYPNRKKYLITEEHRRKISEALKGKQSSLGRKHTEETKTKMSNARKGKSPKNLGISFGLSGDKSILWKGGLCIDINKYNRDRYKNLSEEKRKEVSWLKNKRNRVVKRLKIESLSHTYGEWELLKKQYNYTCPCCGLSEPEIKLTEDHIIPLSKGGSDLIENIQPLCLSCNLKKHTLTIKY